MKINKLLTKYNLTAAKDRKIKYIVVHYVGATGGAEANCKYYASKELGASAHYFVGHNGEVWQSVEDKDIAWHCGAKNYKHLYCRNSNSIGVEMCCKQDSKGNWYFEPLTVASTIDLVKELMRKYNISVDNVLRHYDVTGKNCPQPYAVDGKAWGEFKEALKDKPAATVKPTTKSIEAIAKEVIAGKWGNGSIRINNLIKAGYDYSAVQVRVNEILGANKQEQPPKKSIDAIAREVIKGLWGNGSARINKLSKAGYNPQEVQKRVNALLK